jgi:hypothetical protein
MIDATALCAWGVTGQADRGTQGEVLAGGKHEPEDAEMRRPGAFQACMVVGSII